MQIIHNHKTMSNIFSQWKILAVSLLAMEVLVSSAGQNLDQFSNQLMQVLESRHFLPTPLDKQDPPLMTKLLSLDKDANGSMNNTNEQNFTTAGNSDYAKHQLPIFPFGLRMIEKALQGKRRRGVHFAPDNVKYNRFLEKTLHFRNIFREIRNGIQGNTKMENGVKIAGSNSNTSEVMTKNKRVIKTKNETDKKIPQENTNESFTNMAVETTTEESSGVDGALILTFVLSIEGSLIFSFLGVLGCVIVYYARHRKAFLKKFKSGNKEEEEGINLALFEYTTSRNLDRNSRNPSKPFQAVRQEQRRRP